MLERCNLLKRFGLLFNLTAASVGLAQYEMRGGPGGYPPMQAPAPMMAAPVYAQDVSPYAFAAQAGYEEAAYGGPATGGVTQVGLFSRFCGQDSGSCDSQCDGGCCDGGCGGGGSCTSCGGELGCNCPTCSGLLSRCCIFCQGEGCYLCRGMVLGVPWEWLNYLRPYSQAGVAAQRWYDVSVGVTSMRRTAGGSTPLLTDRPGGTTLFSTSDLDTNGTEAGMYASIAALFGVGGNVEATYYGLNVWEGERVFAINNPPGPLTPFSIGNVNFADFDQATAIGIREESAFHSAELNYRRRWVGPYGRFQGSWLFGARYFDIDEAFDYYSQGPTTFSSLTETRNAITGGQIGLDFWWNVVPGVNLGVEYKYGLMGNYAEQSTRLRSTTGAVTNLAILEEANDSKTANMGELSAMIIYRLSYNWSFRAHYTLINITDVALASTNFNPDINNTGAGAGAFAGRPVNIDLNSDYRVQGWTFGFEYLW